MAPVALIPDSASPWLPSSMIFPNSDVSSHFPQKLLLNTVLSLHRAFGHLAAVNNWSSMRRAKMSSSRPVHHRSLLLKSADNKRMLSLAPQTSDSHRLMVPSFSYVATVAWAAHTVHAVLYGFKWVAWVVTMVLVTSFLSVDHKPCCTDAPQYE